MAPEVISIQPTPNELPAFLMKFTLKMRLNFRLVTPNADTCRAVVVCSHIVICSSAGAGCCGQLQLLLTWPSTAQLHPSINADLTLDPLQVLALLHGLHPKLKQADTGGLLWPLKRARHTATPRLVQEKR